MTKTKSGFLKAGSIIAIVAAAFIAMLGLTSIASQKLVSRELVAASAFEISIDDLEIIDNADGSVIYKNPANGQKLESEEVDLIVDLTKKVLVAVGVYSIAMSIASFVIAVLNLVKVNQEKSKTGLIVTQLVLSIFTANVLTFAFMIVALCLKDNNNNEESVEPVAAT